MPRIEHYRPDVEDLADETPIRRHTRKKGFWSPMTISLVGGGALLAVGLVVVLVASLGKRTGGGVVSPEVRASGMPLPAALDPAESWTHKELTEYLNSKGLKVEQKALITFGGAPCVRYFPARLVVTPVKPASDTPVAIQMAKLQDGFEKIKFAVDCSKEPSRESAMDSAGAKGEGSFAWGRFVFSGNPEFLKKIRIALVAR